MFYIIYKITNLINNKIYIGCHKTTNLDDEYMGSGKILKYAQKKYGIENFKKEILEIFDNPTQMFEMESLLVDKKFIQRDDTYNLKEGGYGGFDFINQSLLNIYPNHKHRARENILNAILHWYEKFENDEEFRKNQIDNAKLQLKIYYANNENGFKNKKHTVESKKKIGVKNALKQSGVGNSQYGSIWIYSITEKISKKINKDEFSDWEAKGWLKGRKMKFF